MGLKKEKVVISRRARRSIREIYEYIKDREKSKEKAHYVRKSILAKCLGLKDFSGFSQESYLEEYPDYMTQGESIEELKENLKDILADATTGHIPGIRKVAELQIA